jgi:hypothetical protein
VNEKHKNNSIEIESFILKKIGTEVHVTYPDGHIINLGMLKIISISTTPTLPNWTVSLLTNEAIQKLKLNITENLELVGFEFKSIQSALLVQSFLVYNILQGEQEGEQDATDNE